MKSDTRVYALSAISSGDKSLKQDSTGSSVEDTANESQQSDDC